jgi:hypothetical protein
MIVLMKGRHIAAWLGLSLVLLGLWVWQSVQEESVSSTRTAITATNAPSPADSDLRIDAWAADARLVSGEHVPLLISIQNPTAKAVWMHFARFQHPGFSRPQMATNAPLPLKIDAGESVTFTFDLVAGDEPGRYAIGAVIAWGNQQTQITRRKPISLRPITISSRLTSGLLLFLRAFQSFVKDLALPLALAFLGFWLKEQEEVRARQRRLDDEKRESDRKADEIQRETARSREDEARVAQRKAAAEKNAQTQQTWNLMLLKSHQNAERHYMPMGNAAERVGYYWDRVPTAADHSAELDLCFFSLLLFLSRMYRMGRLIGGFYFKSRSGETIAAEIWVTIANWCDRETVFSRDLRERATKALGPYETYAEYRLGAAKNRAVKELRRRFLANLTLFGPIALLFQALDVIIEYEMNRPYEHWYGEPEVLNAAKLGSLIGQLRQAGAEYAGLVDALEIYVQQVCSAAGATAAKV